MHLQDRLGRCQHAHVHARILKTIRELLHRQGSG